MAFDFSEENKMTKKTRHVATLSLLGKSKPPIIRITVGYPWSKNNDNQVAAAIADERWKSIRDCVKPVGDWVKTYVSKRLPAPSPFVFEVARLRGTHGRMLLDNLRSRIAEADILIMDIGSSNVSVFNNNVLLEVGMSIAHESEDIRDLFILKPARLNAPSDLNGFLFTDYRITDNYGSIKIIDIPGFQASLRSSVLRKAWERNMIGPRAESYAGLEDEFENAQLPKTRRSGGDKNSAPIKSSRAKAVIRKTPSSK